MFYTIWYTVQETVVPGLNKLVHEKAIISVPCKIEDIPHSEVIGLIAFDKNHTPETAMTIEIYQVDLVTKDYSVGVELKESATNNGGKTDYYALPLPDKEFIASIFRQVLRNELSDQEAAARVLALLPSTLLDLHKFKKFTYHQHEISKANYAIQARAEKNGGSMKRELNKIIFYAQEWVKEIDETLEK